MITTKQDDLFKKLTVVEQVEKGLVVYEKTRKVYLAEFEK